MKRKRKKVKGIISFKNPESHQLKKLTKKKKKPRGKWVGSYWIPD